MTSHIIPHHECCVLQPAPGEGGRVWLRLRYCTTLLGAPRCLRHGSEPPHSAVQPRLSASQHMSAVSAAPAIQSPSCSLTDPDLELAVTRSRLPHVPPQPRAAAVGVGAGKVERKAAGSCCCLETVPAFPGQQSVGSCDPQQTRVTTAQCEVV